LLPLFKGGYRLPADDVLLNLHPALVQPQPTKVTPELCERLFAHALRTYFE
jgi:hypothetical protein